MLAEHAERKEAAQPVDGFETPSARGGLFRVKTAPSANQEGHEKAHSANPEEPHQRIRMRGRRTNASTTVRSPARFTVCMPRSPLPGCGRMRCTWRSEYSCGVR